MEKIQHLVVLMLENRSFDHMLGYLRHPRDEFPRFDRPASNPDSRGQAISTSPTAARTIRVGPGHHHADVMRQIAPNGNLNNQGFVIDYELRVTVA